MKVLIEAAIDTIDAASRAVREGADRLEVCARLDVGGLTPPAALVRACRQLGVPCVAMVRVRAGGFVCSTDEVKALVRDATAMVEAGAGGIVFGVLRANGEVDADAVRALVRVAGESESVFHRAFDEVPDREAALEVLIDAGVTRVLTSGGAPTAVEGADAIAKLVARARARMQILAGGGVRGHNVREVIRVGGVRQVHARATDAGVIGGIGTAVDGMRG